MADREAVAVGDHEATFERRVKLLTGVVAPTTVVAALLFYFGYVSTVAEFGWFGIGLSSLELSYQDVVLRSAGALYAPLGLILLSGLACLWVHAAARSVVAAGRHARAVRLTASASVALGVLVLARGVVGVLVPDVARSEPVATTPICLGLGVGLVAYGRHLYRSAEGRSSGGGAAPWVETAARAAVAGLVVIAIFWATNSFAAAYGRGRGQMIAERLESRPSVVLDTTERLYAQYAGLTESALPHADGQLFRFRYTGLHLLIESNDRLFLVPAGWSPGDGAVIVVPADERARVQLYRS